MDRLRSWLRRRWTLVVFSGISALVIMALYTFEIKTGFVTTCRVLVIRCTNNKGFRHHHPSTSIGSLSLSTQLAMEIRGILHHLQSDRGRGKPPDAQTLLALENVMGRLDPTLLPLPYFSYQDQQILLKVDGDGTEVEVCPEEYKGLIRNSSNLTDAFTSTCSDNVPLDQIVTLTLDSTNLTAHTLHTLLQDVMDRYKSLPVVVAVASSSVEQVVRKFQNVKIVLVTTSTPEVVRWTRLQAVVTTKYILFGRRVNAFSQLCGLERLVRALRLVPDAAYVAGSTREESGRWRVGCYQSRLELYGLVIREGYINSDHECMYCGAADGPFLTTKSLLASIPLNQSLPSEVAFFDWFLQVRNTGKLGLVCPDVMFFVTEQRTMWKIRKPWLAMAAKWGATHIHLPDHSSHHFTCREAGLVCGDIDSHHAIPSCCLARLGRELQEIVSVLQGLNLSVHLDDRTVADGMKGGLQPIRAEAHLAAHNNPPVIGRAMETLRDHGFQVKNENKKYQVFVQGAKMKITLHLHSQMTMTAGLPKTQSQQPTLVYLGGSWLPAPPSPGQYARAHLGHTTMRHLAPGERWPPCGSLSSLGHACLDLLPYDGTLTKLR